MRQKESVKEEKRWKKVERKIYQDLYVGEGFTNRTFLIFGPLPSGLRTLGGPLNPKDTTGKTFSYTSSPKTYGQRSLKPMDKEP
jgi:hypothetical protein